MRSFPAETVKSYLEGKLDRGSRALFFINDLPRQCSDKQLKTLGEYLKALERCSPSYFIATARSDHLKVEAGLQDWLKQNEVKPIELKPLTEEQIGLLVDDLAENIFDIRMEEEIKGILVKKSDGTPYHTYLTVKYLSEGQEITAEQAERIASKKTEEIWNDLRKGFEAIEPATASLLEALAVFYHADVSPDYFMVMAYAEKLELTRQWYPPWAAQRRLARALKLVEDYGISHQDRFMFPEVAVEALIPPETALPSLEQFARSYRQAYRRPLLHRLNRRAASQQAMLMGLAITYYFKEELRKAQELVLLAMETGIPTGFMYAILGELYWEEKRYELAVQAYRRAVALEPDDGDYHYNLGVALEHAGRYAEAVEAYRRAVALDPDQAGYHYNLGVALGHAGRYAEAVEAYRRAIALDPDQAGYYNNLGVALRHAGRYAEAVEAFQEAIRLKPGQASYHASLGAVYRKLGLHLEADQELAEAQRLSPSESDYNRACIAALCGDAETALAFLASAITQDKTLSHWARRDLDFESLHEDPRFWKIVGEELG